MGGEVVGERGEFGGVAAEPPAHLVLGSDALRLVTAARTAVDENIRAWETLSRTTDFPVGAQL